MIRRLLTRSVVGALVLFCLVVPHLAANARTTAALPHDQGAACHGVGAWVSGTQTNLSSWAHVTQALAAGTPDTDLYLWQQASSTAAALARAQQLSGAPVAAAQVDTDFGMAFAYYADGYAWLVAAGNAESDASAQRGIIELQAGDHAFDLAMTVATHLARQCGLALTA